MAARRSRGPEPQPRFRLWARQMFVDRSHRGSRAAPNAPIGPAVAPWVVERRRHGNLGARRGLGFTLVELLVVLVLVGLLATLVMPNLDRLRASFARTTERDRILDQFAALGAQAQARGQGYVVFGNVDENAAPLPGGDYERYRLDIPDGWQVRLTRPLLIHPNGVCLGSELTLRHHDAAPLRIDLLPPYCRVDADG